VHIQGTEVAEAYQDVVARFLGEENPKRVTQEQKPRFIKPKFGGR
jgi:septum site-determining protein MinD